MNENNKSLPKDVFLHLLGIIALYISAGSLIALLFQYINILFPDPLFPIYYSSVAWPIRWSMASLIIVFPVYLLVSWLLYKDYSKNPEKRELKIRKWLVYFTLFLTAIVIITDLVTLVYNFLGGDLTGRFLLKILVILLVAGTIFEYYLLDLRNKLAQKNLRLLAWSVALIILISVAGGFFTAGSPFKARLYQFDERRINDLQILQNEIINYWIQKGQLPAQLVELKNDITGFMPPQDPENNLPYEYKVASPLSFELCAVFNLPSEGLVGSPKATPVQPYYEGPYRQNWSHDLGKTCFIRTIDPELYKIQKEQKPWMRSSY
ncbi:MAG: hypothetical protein HZB99_01885 [Candidatus Harrisonbacteria bacterium]|nr:hypothetical protein [Candidatus Harrisonbacteria bacterium]